MQDDLKPDDGAQPSVTDKEFTLRRLDVYLELYRHHFDAFLRGYYFYLMCAGAIAGFALRPGAQPSETVALMVFQTIGSIVVLSACMVSRYWLRNFVSMVRKIEKKLGAEEFPFWGPQMVLWIFIWTAGAIALTSVILLNTNATWPW